MARWRGVAKVFFTDQGSHPEGYVATRRPAWKRLAARALNLPLNQVICISDYNVDCMLRRDLIDAGRVTRIYNSVDLAAAHGDGAAFRLRHGVPAGAPVVAQASWMIPEKGITDLVEAARIVLERIPQAHFLLAGEGKHRNEYMAMARDLGMEEHFTWTGLVHNPVAEGLYAAADVVCQVSRWEEAFGWVIAEAMAAGRPLVATRVGGIPELVTDGENGFLVAPRAPAEIAAAPGPVARGFRLARPHGSRRTPRRRTQVRSDEQFGFADACLWLRVAQSRTRPAPWLAPNGWSISPLRGTAWKG